MAFANDLGTGVMPDNNNTGHLRDNGATHTLCQPSSSASSALATPHKHRHITSACLPRSRLHKGSLLEVSQHLRQGQTMKRRGKRYWCSAGGSEPFTFDYVFDKLTERAGKSSCIKTVFQDVPVADVPYFDSTQKVEKVLYE